MGVVGSDLLKTAALNQKYKSQIYKHGQHAPNPGCMRECNDFCLVYCSCCCNDPNYFEYHIEEGHSLMLPDFHFAPMRPKDYICHRIDATMNFYSARVPRYSRCKSKYRQQKERMDVYAEWIIMAPEGGSWLTSRDSR